MAALYTSRDRAINEPLGNAGKSVLRYPAFAEAFEGHAYAWDELWAACDIQLPRQQRAQFLLRLHTSHLLQTCSRLTAHHDAGVPARGLNSEAHRGHVFCDELFVYPFLNFRLPEITRGLASPSAASIITSPVSPAPPLSQGSRRRALTGRDVVAWPVAEGRYIPLPEAKPQGRCIEVTKGS